MRHQAFTIAYGSGKYRKMAKLLEIGVSTFSPETEFRVFTGDDIESRPAVGPKDRFRGKLEICSKCNDPDTRYIFMDSDIFVFCDLEPIFDLIEEGSITLVWRKSPGGKWAGRQDLDFPLACRRAGLEGDIQAYNLNAGFMMWQGGIDLFDRALHIFDNYEFPDWKGIHGADEYSICAAIQLSDVEVRNIEDYEENELRAYWAGKLSRRDGMLHSDAYEIQGRIQHYGGGNWRNRHVRAVARSIVSKYYRPAGLGQGLLARLGILWV